MGFEIQRSSVGQGEATEGTLAEIKTKLTSIDGKVSTENTLSDVDTSLNAVEASLTSLDGKTSDDASHDALMNPDNTTLPVTISVSSVSAESAQLPTGLYIMQSDIDVGFRQGATGGTAVYATDRKLFEYSARLIKVTGVGDDYIQAITEVAPNTGIVSLEKID